MGHNWALSLTKDMQAINTAAIKAGPKKDYTPTHKALIAVTPLIGGGKSTSVTFDSSKLKVGAKYSFFCTFPGHSSLMKGSFIVK